MAYFSTCYRRWESFFLKIATNCILNFYDFKTSAYVNYGKIVTVDNLWDENST